METRTIALSDDDCGALLQLCDDTIKHIAEAATSTKYSRDPGLFERLRNALGDARTIGTFNAALVLNLIDKIASRHPLPTPEDPFVQRLRACGAVDGVGTQTDLTDNGRTMRGLLQRWKNTGSL
jgi:hypothetical protein